MGCHRQQPSECIGRGGGVCVCVWGGGVFLLHDLIAFHFLIMSMAVNCDFRRCSWWEVLQRSPKMANGARQVCVCVRERERETGEKEIELLLIG